MGRPTVLSPLVVPPPFQHVYPEAVTTASRAVNSLCKGSYTSTDLKASRAENKLLTPGLCPFLDTLNRLEWVAPPQCPPPQRNMFGALYRMWQWKSLEEGGGATLCVLLRGLRPGFQQGMGSALWDLVPCDLLSGRASIQDPTAQPQRVKVPTVRQCLYVPKLHV